MILEMDTFSYCISLGITAVDRMSLLTSVWFSDDQYRHFKSIHIAILMLPVYCVWGYLIAIEEVGFCMRLSIYCQSMSNFQDVT